MGGPQKPKWKYEHFHHWEYPVRSESCIRKFKYGPESPGRGKPSIFVLFIFERQSRCGLWNEGIKLWSSVAFPKWMGDLNYWRKKFEKSIFMDFFDGFFERFFHYIEKHVNLSIENLPLYDTYEFFVAYYERELDLNFSKHPQHDLIR